MDHYRLIRSDGERNPAVVGAQALACPRCSVRFVFCRNRDPVIDACGFESYALECHGCGASLTGIVDPLDDALLLSAMPA
jgi:hypothetical protein